MTQTNSHPEQRHEAVSVRPRPIMLAVVGLVVLIVGSLFIVSGVDSFLGRSDQPLVVPAEDASTPARGTPFEPDQGEQKREYLAEQAELLDSYGWVDREQDIARIPIGDAMRLYVERREDAE